MRDPQKQARLAAMQTHRTHHHQTHRHSLVTKPDQIRSALLTSLGFIIAAAYPCQAALPAVWSSNPETEIAGYTIFTGTTHDNLVPYKTVGKDNTSYTISGLAPSTTYYCSVQAFSITGVKSGMSPLITYTTPATSLTASEITVKNSVSENLSSGSSVSFGDVTVGSVSRTETITVTNQGVAALTDLDVSYDGPNVEDFMVSSIGATSLAPGESTTFDITFVPSAAGGRSSNVYIASNDADENPFVITLLGNTTAKGLFDAWSGAVGLSGSAAAADAMPFGDGVTNLLKYAFNMDADGPDLRVLTPESGTAGLPSISLDQSGMQPFFQMEYLRRKGSGLIYTPKVSSDLVQFTQMTGTSTITPIDQNWERVVIQKPCDPGLNPRLFGILEVTLP